MQKTYLHRNILYLRKKAGLQQTDIQAKTGIKRNTWSNWENNVSEPSIDNIVLIAHFFDISIDNLLTVDLEKGNLIQKNDVEKADRKGNPIGNPIGNLSEEYNEGHLQSVVTETPNTYQKKSLMPQVVVSDPQGKENVVFVPVKARAGYLAGYGDPEYIEKLPSYRLPGLNNGTYRAFEVSGLSMETLFYEGDVVFCRWTENLSDVREKDIYVFLTDSEGIAIKRVLSHISGANKLLLGSENPLYSPVLLDYTQIHEIWKPITYMSNHFRTQNSLESRLSELETRLIRLEEKEIKSPLK